MMKQQKKKAIGINRTSKPETRLENVTAIAAAMRQVTARQAAAAMGQAAVQEEVVIPTIEEVMAHYSIIAPIERMKTGRPCEASARHVIAGSKAILAAAGIALEERVDAITRRRIDGALVEFDRRGLRPVSARTYVDQLRALFARWCRPYYEDAGWTIPPIVLPVMRVKMQHYVRPSVEKLARVKSWYLGLSGERWFAATMMLEFAMRNGDVMRLRDENFVLGKNEAAGDGGRQTEQHFLSYTPHKTEQSSGRKVYWPIHDVIWQKMSGLGGPAAIIVTTETFDKINHDLRELGFDGKKAAYELRKICIDHIYQKYGAEKAVSISGDDIKTISRYYADPARPNIGAAMVVDML